MYNDNNYHSRSQKNGSRPSLPSIFNDQDSQFPSGSSQFDEDNDLEPDRSQPLTEQGKENLRLLRRFYLTLIITGVVLGGLLSWGVITVMSEWNMINPPEQRLNQ